MNFPETLNPDQWLDEHGDVLYRYALARVRDRSLAEDLVQETLVAALKAKDSFAGRAAERTWLVGILKHKIIDALRKRGRETPLEELPSAADEPGDWFDERGEWRVAPSAWGRPEQSLEQDQFWRVLQDCIDRLPERLAAVFTLREIDGLESEEICNVLEVSTTNNLWVMLSRARMRLRQCLEIQWFAVRDQEGER
jgi:RNA polymerase sigma-70 factor (ECF subfamily)